MAVLPLWKTRNDSNSQHGLKIPKILLDTSEDINFGLFVPLASPPGPTSSHYSPPWVDWRSTREVEEWKGVLGNLRWGAVQEGSGGRHRCKRRASSTGRAQSVYSATMDRSTVMSSGFPPLTFNPLSQANWAKGDM